MPLAAPPIAAGSLVGLPRWRLRGEELVRVWRHRTAEGATRGIPWWFASLPPDPQDGGRFDLPAPMGTCSTATTAAGALLESLQAHLTNLPLAELKVRRGAWLSPPDDAPPAAKLKAQRLAGEHGLGAELRAGPDHRRAQAWAAALRRDGWWALYTGVRHDPTGRLRACAIFDAQGAHPPTHGGTWGVSSRSLHDDDGVRRELARFGVHVREPGVLPLVSPEAS